MLCFDKSLEINPEYARAWLEKGIALLYLNKLNDAMLCFDKSLEINKEYIEAWIGKGFVLLDLNKYEDSIVCFDKALKIDSNHELAKNGLKMAKDKREKG
ncbi:MAG TPA: tetratricopeptide repeat protein [Methanosarcinales archaeon]|nr:tetratricopeptide repeat protein [Methanosarcinales archaeon]